MLSTLWWTSIPSKGELNNTINYKHVYRQHVSLEHVSSKCFGASVNKALEFSIMTVFPTPQTTLYIYVTMQQYDNKTSHKEVLPAELCWRGDLKGTVLVILGGEKVVFVGFDNFPLVIASLSTFVEIVWLLPIWSIFLLSEGLSTWIDCKKLSWKEMLEAVNSKIEGNTCMLFNFPSLEHSQGKQNCYLTLTWSKARIFEASCSTTKSRILWYSQKVWLVPVMS